AIQKVLSNKRAALKAKLKTSDTAEHRARQPEEEDNNNAFREAPALSRLLGITAYSGRDKFRDDRHNEIYEYAKTLPGTTNAGGKFRKAEALMWAQEDRAVWDAAAAVQEDVDWNERQKLVATGFEQMVDNLHASRKFRPFVATMMMGWLNEDGKVIFEWQVSFISLDLTEAVPEEIGVAESFRRLHPQLVQQTLNAMYTWAENPLKEYLITREASAKQALDDLSHNVLVSTVTTYLEESFEAAFGTGEIIPWAEMASQPSRFYDTTRFQLGFTLTGLADLSRSQWYELAGMLAASAGTGTLGFFRQADTSDPPAPAQQLPSRTSTPQPLPPSRSPSPPPPPPGLSPSHSPSPSPPLPPPPPPASSPSRSPSPPRPSPSRSPSPLPPSRSPSPPPSPPPRVPRRLRGAVEVPPRETRSTTAKRVAEDEGGAKRKRLRRRR
ncbi:hypothetical protein GGX14DRAFT_399589, partial [Mycena pura]